VGYNWTGVINCLASFDPIYVSIKQALKSARGLTVCQPFAKKQVYQWVGSVQFLTTKVDARSSDWLEQSLCWAATRKSPLLAHNQVKVSWKSSWKLDVQIDSLDE
jgi:hypothetical protein